MSDSDKQTDRDHAITQLQFLHTYIYNIKRDTETRAASLISIIVILVAVLALAVNAAIGFKHPATFPDATLTVIRLLGWIGSSAALVSLTLALSILWPQQPDPGSHMSTRFISKADSDSLAQYYREHCTERIIDDLVREIKALATAQRFRSRATQFAIGSLTVSLICLAVVAVEAALKLHLH
jgi:hypothetical protein